MTTDDQSLKRVNDELVRHSDILQDLMDSVHSIKRFIVNIDRKISNIESKQDKEMTSGGVRDYSSARGARDYSSDVTKLEKTKDNEITIGVRNGCSDVTKLEKSDAPGPTCKCGHLTTAVMDAICHKVVEMKQHVSESLRNREVFTSDVFEKKMNTLRCYVTDDVVKKIGEIRKDSKSAKDDVVKEIRQQKEHIVKDVKRTMAENIKEVTLLKQIELQEIKELKNQAASVVENVQNETQRMLETNNELSNKMTARMSGILDNTIELTKTLADMKETIQQQPEVLTKEESIDRLAEMTSLIDQLPQTDELMLREEMNEHLKAIWISIKAEGTKPQATAVAATQHLKIHPTRQEFLYVNDYGEYIHNHLKKGMRVRQLVDVSYGVKRGDTGTVVFVFDGSNGASVLWDNAGCDIGVWCKDVEIIE